MIRDLHAKGTGPVGEGDADSSHADDAESATLQAGAKHHEHAPLPRCAGSDQPLPLAESACHHEHERHREVGGGVGQHPRGIGHSDPSGPTGGNVDVVVSNGHVGNHPQGRCRVEERLIDSVGEQGDRVVGGGELLVTHLGRDHLVAGPRPHVCDLSQ